MTWLAMSADFLIPNSYTRNPETALSHELWLCLQKLYGTIQILYLSNTHTVCKGAFL